MILGFRVVRSCCLCCDQGRDIFSVLIEVLIHSFEFTDGERRGRGVVCGVCCNGEVSKAGAVSLSLQFLSSVENKLCRSERSPSKLFCSAFFLSYPSADVSLWSLVGRGSSARDLLGCVLGVCLAVAVKEEQPLLSPASGQHFGSPSSARGRDQILALPVLAPDPDFPLQPFPVPTAEKGKPSPETPPEPCTHPGVQSKKLQCPPAHPSGAIPALVSGRKGPSPSLLFPTSEVFMESKHISLLP